MTQQQVGTKTDPARKPLAGKRIVITRARAQAEQFARRVEDLGGEVVEFPTIEIRAPESFAEFDAALENIASYDWLIFTSVNSVEPFLTRLKEKGKTAAALHRLKVGAIGPETAKRLENAGIRTALVPDRYQAEGILDAVSAEKMRGKRVLIPRAAEAREILPETLRQRGATVDVIIAYRTALPVVDVRPLAELLAGRRVDAVTFTSSSTVRNFVRLFGGKSLAEIVNGSRIACIGPITAETVKDLGGRAEIVAREFTVSGMVRAMVEYFTAN